MASSMQDPEYKAILVKNETRNLTVVLSVYWKSDPFCWLSWEKESIEPGKQYFVREDDAFKYRIGTEKKEEKLATTVLPVQKWEEDKLITVKDEGLVDVDKLSQHPGERRKAFRRKNMLEETENGRDLYGILKLNMKEVQRAPLEEQDKMIKRACYEQMLIFHPAHNPDYADGEICQEIFMAYIILGDREKRALYHDLTNYKGGWLSKSRWKAIFTPEAHGSNEKWKRIGLLVFSAVLVAAGCAITVCTAAFGIPMFLGAEIVANALMEGAMQGAFKVVSYDSIENGVKVEKYILRFVHGASVGAAAGGFFLYFDPIMGTGGDIPDFEDAVKFLEEGAAKKILLSTTSIGDTVKHADKGAVIGSSIGIVCSGLAKAEAKVRMAGKTKLQAIKEKMSGASDCIEHIATPITVALVNSGSNEKSDRKREIEDSRSNENSDRQLEIEDSRSVITYTCKEPYFTRMIVSYLDDRDRKNTEIVEGSGSNWEIPHNARHIKVSFQNQRFIKTWCDVKKYDRIKKRWHERTVPHVFTLLKPVTRTFTLEGSLYYVAVMKVRNEVYQDLDIME